MEILGFQITGYQIAFLAVGGLTVLSALAVVFIPNILRAALCLGLCLFCVAGLYMLLNAPFLAVVQIMIYVGAITTMIILAIFLSHRVMNVGFSQAIYNPLLAAAAAGIMFLFLFVTVVNSVWIKTLTANGPSVSGSDINMLAQTLLQPYAFSFELASLVLVAVLVGAIVLGKEDKADA